MAGWTGLLRRATGYYGGNRLAQRVWLLSVAAAVTGICVALGVDLGSRTSYVIAGVGGVVALLLPWWLSRGSDV